MKKYPRDYQPKIEYYQALLSIAVDRLDLSKIKFYTTKLEYFIGRNQTLLDAWANWNTKPA